MKGERKILSLAGKTIKKIQADKYRLLIQFTDGSVLNYHMMTDNNNYIDIMEKPTKRFMRYKRDFFSE